MFRRFRLAVETQASGSPVPRAMATSQCVKVYSMPAIGHRNVTARLRGLAGVE
jgi:hypothetical protein